MVNLPWTSNDGKGQMWRVYQNGALQNQGPTPNGGNTQTFSQAAILVINGNNPQMQINQGKVDEKTGELILENMQGAGYTVTRRIHVDKEGGYVRYIDVIKNTQGQDQNVQLMLTTNLNYGINTSQVTAKAGLNEASWNLQYPPPDRVVLRSIPPDDPHIWEQGRWEGRERPVDHWGLGAMNYRPRAVPGKYTVRLTLNGKPYSQPFEVWRDVTLPSTDADLAASFNLQRRIITLMNEVADKINKIEIMRMQVEDLRKEHASDAVLDKALAGIYTRMYDTELHFLSRTEMHSDDKWYVEKYKVYFNLIWLLAEVGGGGGDVMGGAGYAPTVAAGGVFEDRLKDVQAGRSAFTGLMQEIESFNRTYSGRLPPIRSER